MVEYRNSTQIVADLLSFTQESGQQGIRVTPLAVKSNLSYSRMSSFLKNLTGSELINKIEYDGKNVFVITEKGRTYLEEYKKFTSIANSFGLEL